MRELNLPVTREDYLNLAYLGRPPKQLSAEEEAGFARDSGPLALLVSLLPPATGTSVLPLGGKADEAQTGQENRRS